MIDLFIDHLLDAVGHTHIHLIDACNQLPKAFIVDYRTIGQKVIDGVQHKQRIPLGAFMDQGRQSSWKSIGRESNRQILRNGIFLEVFQRQFFALLPGQQFAFDGFEWMSGDDQLDRPIGANQHQMCGMTLSCQVRDQVQRRVIAPVKIFQDKHQRHVGGQHLQSLTHFPQHPLASRSKHLPTEQFTIGCVDQRRQLQ